MDPMAAWYGTAVQVEKALAMRESGQHTDAHFQLREAADYLRQIYAPLAEFHAAFIALLRSEIPDVAAIEGQLDQLYY